MTLDEIIEKYGMHELDIDCVKKDNGNTVVYAYCHQHNVNDQFMVNHFLEIKGKISVLEKEVEDENDFFIHLATIEKKSDGTYEMGGAGDWVHFQVDSALQVTELTEKAFSKRSKPKKIKKKGIK